jgi:hypothetical protein
MQVPKSEREKYISDSTYVDQNNLGEGVAYFLVRSGDTSLLKCYVSASGDTTEIYIEPDYEKDISKNLSYREEMMELPLLLREASKSFNIANTYIVKGVGIWGDLAIDLTKQWNSKYSKRRISNKLLAEFLLESKMTDDLNSLLSPYNIAVSRYILEKAQFASSSEIHKYYKIETPQSQIPEEIISASIYGVLVDSIARPRF